MISGRRVAIVGAGHNGLVCATLLAKAGFGVTVYEKRSTLGGGAGDFEFAPGFRAAALAHYQSDFHPKLREALGLPALARPKAATTVLSSDGAPIRLQDDEVTGDGLDQNEAAEFKAFYTEYLSYAKALEPLLTERPPRLKNMDRKDQISLAKIGWSLRFGLGVDAMREFLRIGGMNIADVLDERFKTDALKAAIALDAVQGHGMAPRTPTTALTYLTRLFAEAFNPPSIYTSKTSGISTLITAAEAVGVKIKTETPINKITIENDRVNGVRLNSGSNEKSDIVVSNADAKTTFLTLAGAENLDAMFVHRISKTRTDGTTARLLLALSDAPTFKGLSPDDLNGRIVVAPDLRYIERAFNAVKYGEFSTEPVLEITVPTAIDPSMALNGGHVLSINASYAPYRLKEGWESGGATFEEIILKTLERYAPGIRELILHKKFFSPVDIEGTFGIAGGHWHHGEMAIDQSFMMRPVHGAAQYSTPVRGLFLCGAAAHPGGGVTGLPGWNAAKRIISMAKAGSL